MGSCREWIMKEIKSTKVERIIWFMATITEAIVWDCRSIVAERCNNSYNNNKNVLFQRHSAL